VSLTVQWIHVSLASIQVSLSRSYRYEFEFYGQSEPTGWQEQIVYVKE